MSYKKIYKDGKPVRKEDRKDGNLKYKYKIRCYSAGGREINRHVLAMNDREAALIEHDLVTGDITGDTHWSAAVEKFCKDHAVMRTDRYLDDVRKAVSLFVAKKGDLPIEETPAGVMASYLNSMSNTPRQANLHRSMLLSVSRYFKKKLLIKSVPFESVPKIENYPQKRYPFTVEEYNRHYDALSEYARPIFMFLALSGCRVNAACSLTEDDVNGQQLKLFEKGMHGKKKERIVIIDSYLNEVLLCARNMKKSKGLTSKFVFVNARGNPWKNTALGHNVKKAWEKRGLIIKEAGRPHILHELRHGYGTIAGQLNFGSDMIAASLGHSCRHTSEIYVHSDATMAFEAGTLIRPKIAEAFISGKAV